MTIIYCDNFQIVYITRNPKDTAVSFYHFMKELSYFQYDADFETFLDLFLAGKGKISRGKKKYYFRIS